MTTLHRGTGLLDEDPNLVAEQTEQFPLTGIVSGVTRPAQVSWRHLLDKILDQGSTNSCVGCSFSTAIFLRARVIGMSNPVRPSQKIIYDHARGAYGEEDWQDVGCYPFDAVDQTSKKGMVPEAAWPLFTNDPSLLALRPKGKDGKLKEWIDTPPPFDIYHEAYDLRLTGLFRAAQTGDLIEALESAIAIGHIPSWGMRVANDYGDVRGTEIYETPNVSTQGLGGHMQAIIGYDTESFHIASSWGTSHGQSGVVRIRKGFVADRRWSYSHLIITAVPKGLEA